MEYQTITRTRGDTYPFTVTFRDSSGVAVDLTGASFILTVNAEEDPTALQAPLFALAGTINAPTTGVVEFEMTESAADNVGPFYYDIQMTDAQGYIRTMMRGPFIMEQDITKNSYLWTAESKTAVDGTDGIWLGLSDESDTWEYAIRDATSVLRVVYPGTIKPYDPRSVLPTDWPLLDFGRNLRLSCLQWMDESWYLSLWLPSSNSYYCYFFVSNTQGWRRIDGGARTYNEDQIYYSKFASGPERLWTAGWIQWVMEWDASTGTLGVRGWQPPTEVDPLTPDFEISGVAPPPFEAYERVPMLFLIKPEIGFPTTTGEIAWLKYEVLP